MSATEYEACLPSVWGHKYQYQIPVSQSRPLSGGFILGFQGSQQRHCDRKLLHCHNTAKTAAMELFVFGPLIIQGSFTESNLS